MTYIAVWKIQYFASFALVGLIWTIQIVHYPLMKYVTIENFKSFHEQHSQFISWIVIPLMLTEAFSLMYIAYYELASNKAALIYTLIFLTTINWFSTFLIQVPIHTKLSHQGYSLQLIEKLILTNWIRTISWSFKGVIIIISFL